MDREAVRRRAGGMCEYCRLPDDLVPTPFEIEHVIAEQHLGTATPGNLAYSCLLCNRHKGPNVAGLDRIGRVTLTVRLYNPRRQKWSKHFAWDGPMLVGRTPVGRVTVAVLKMNHPVRLTIRAELIAEGLFPPAG